MAASTSLLMLMTFLPRPCDPGGSLRSSDAGIKRGAEAMRGVGGQTITVQVPLKLKKCGGQKRSVTSDTETVGAAAAHRQRDGQGVGAGVPVAADVG